MSESIYTHYTYLLLDENHKKYGGVRSCKVTPEKDPYMGSSDYVCEAIDNGLIFTKHIIKTFDTREEAMQYESEWLVRVGAARSDDWYNQRNTYPKWDNQGDTHTEKTKRKMSEALKGIPKSEEQKRKRLETIANKSPEEIAEIKRKQVEGHAKRTPDQEAERIRKQVETIANKTPEQKAETKRKQREGHAKRTPEEKAETTRKRLEAYKRTKANKKGTVE